MDNNLQLISLNLRRIKVRERLQEIGQWLDNQEPDIILLQEVGIIAFNKIMKGYQVIYNLDESVGDGVGIMILIKEN